MSTPRHVEVSNRTPRKSLSLKGENIFALALVLLFVNSTFSKSWPNYKALGELAQCISKDAYVGHPQERGPA